MSENGAESRFQRLVDAHGPELDDWPAEEAREGRAFIEAEPARAESVLAAERAAEAAFEARLDRIAAADRPLAPGPALVERVLADAASVSSRSAPARPPGLWVGALEAARGLWRELREGGALSAGAIAAAAAAGVAFGLAGPGLDGAAPFEAIADGAGVFETAFEDAAALSDGDEIEFWNGDAAL